jgi:hypothetical protein
VHPARTYGYCARPPVSPGSAVAAGRYRRIRHVRALPAIPWVLKEHVYSSPQHLIADLGERVIGPAEAKVRELRG